MVSLTHTLRGGLLHRVSLLAATVLLIQTIVPSRAQPQTEDTLQRLFKGSSISVTEFLTDYYDKKPFHAQGANCHDVIGLSSRHMDAIVGGFSSSEGHEEGLVNMVDIKFAKAKKDEKKSATEKAVTTRGTYHYPGDDVITPPQAQYLFVAKNMTAVILQAHQRWPPIFNTAFTLADELAGLPSANIYYTPKSSQGFQPHWDFMDVFVCQLEGEKEWSLYGSATERSLMEQKRPPKQSELESSTKIQLRQGDILYIPRGEMHSARTSADTESLHVTFGVQPVPLTRDIVDVLLTIPLIADGDRFLHAVKNASTGVSSPAPCFDLPDDGKEVLISYARMIGVGVYALSLRDAELRSAAGVDDRLLKMTAARRDSVVPIVERALNHVANFTAIWDVIRRSALQDPPEMVNGKASYVHARKATVRLNLPIWPMSLGDYIVTDNCIFDHQAILQDRLDSIKRVLDDIVTKEYIMDKFEMVARAKTAEARERVEGEQSAAKKVVEKHLKKWRQSGRAAQSDKGKGSRQDDAREDGEDKDEL